MSIRRRLATLILAAACGTLLLGEGAAWATHPGANGRIAWGPGVGLESINPDGTGWNYKLIDSMNSTPAWSPDGARFTWSSGGVIHVMSSDYRALKEITTVAFISSFPSWSPDGGHIVLGRYVNEVQYDLFTMDFNGKGVARLTNTPENEKHPAYSPDGSQIAYWREDAIHVIDASGGPPETLTCSLCADEADDGPLSWSPDGTKIAYAANQRIAVVDVETKTVAHLTPVATETNYASGPDWSPDGAQIAYRYSGPGGVGNGVWLMGADGSNQHRLPGVQDKPSRPAWQPTCTVKGGPGNDVLTGTSGDDFICGLGGKDTIRGLGGADILIGGTGDDRLVGAAGGDLLIGGVGSDRAAGGGGPDVIDSADGKKGNDRLDGGSSGDLCRRDSKDSLVSCP